MAKRTLPDTMSDVPAVRDERVSVPPDSAITPSYGAAQRRWCAIVSALIDDGHSMATAMELATQLLRGSTPPTSDADDTARIELEAAASEHRSGR
jgi:hypothetical protein